MQFRRHTQSGEEADLDAIRRELKQWERYAIRRLPLKQAGQVPDHPFVVEALPADLAFEISARLLAAESVRTCAGCSGVRSDGLGSKVMTFCKVSRQSLCS